MADLATKEREEEENENVTAEDEDTGAQIAPIVKLEEVAVTTGEEDEDPILDLKSKLYRFDKEGNQWKERGSGTVKFLKHKETGKVRLVMRQSKTLKICANHLIIAGMTVQEHAGNDKCCVWHASDFADKELKDEMFCIRFATVENCKKFMEMFQEVAESQQPQGESSEASETAEALEKLTVVDGDKGKAKETETETKPETETATKKEDDVKVDEKKAEEDSSA
ncbi:ran-binding protein 1 homolog b [Silene latifolia]|uniref:ran-binding protein 1 homolog b n=1 Tax=Silene latifolia TaxID=37657 RepID=UPI003D77B98A